MDETDAVVDRVDPHPAARWRCSRALKAGRVPCAPVRTAPEVMHDPHMHERGMLEEIDHPELGPITVPTSPLRLHGIDQAPAGPSPTVGQHNAEIYGGWLGLSAAELAALRQPGRFDALSSEPISRYIGPDIQ